MSHILSGGIRFGFYEIFKRFYGVLFGEKIGDKLRWINYGLAAASAEFLATTVALPFNNVKVVAENYLSLEQIEKIRADPNLVKEYIPQESFVEK